MRDKRVYKVVNSAGTGETSLHFFPDWWSPHFSADKDTIETAVREHLMAL